MYLKELRGVPQKLGSPVHCLIRSVKEGQGKSSIDTLDPGSGQIAVEEECDGLAELRDLVVVVVVVVPHKLGCVPQKL